MSSWLPLFRRVRGPSEHDTFCPRQRRKFVLWAAILASSMGFIDSFVVSIAMPAIRSDLGASLADSQWIYNSYLLMLSSLILIGGAIGDRYGLRLVFGLGIVLFTLASVGCALAPEAFSLIGARTAQGIGAAVMVPGSLAIIAKTYPKAERGRAIGIWAAAASLTMVIGPVLGGFVITTLGEWSWRVLFAINIPLGTLAIGLLWLRVPADPPGEFKRLDLPGGALATVGLFLIAFGLTGQIDAGGNADIGAMALYGGIGVALLAAFIVWEWRFAEPMMPLSLFASRSFSGANALTFFLYFALSSILFFLPMAAISGWGESAAAISWLFVPIAVLLTVMSGPAGRLADRFGPAPLITLGSSLVAAAFAGLALTAHRQNVWFEALPLMTVMGFGMGFVVSPLSTAVMTSVGDEETGVASGINNAISRVAGLVAVAAMGGVAAFVFAAQISGTDAAGAGVSFGAMPEAGTVSEAAEAARIAASNSAFAAVAWVTAALAGLSAVIAWMTLEWRSGRPEQAAA